MARDCMCNGYRNLPLMTLTLTNFHGAVSVMKMLLCDALTVIWIFTVIAATGKLLFIIETLHIREWLRNDYHYEGSTVM